MVNIVASIIGAVRDVVCLAEVLCVRVQKEDCCLRTALGTGVADSLRNGMEASRRTRADEQTRMDALSRPLGDWGASVESRPNVGKEIYLK
jgi:hypothetical protein